MQESLAPRSDRQVGSRVVRGAALMSFARLLVRGTSFINLIVLARLLDPRDYGVAALAFSTLTLLQSLSDVRVAAAIVNLRELTHRHLHTAFTLNLLRGSLLAVTLLAGAELVAGWSRSPEAAAPMRALAVLPLLDGLRNPAMILYQRNIDFRFEFRRTVIAAAVTCVTVIAAAVVLRSYWALIIGAVAGRAAECLMTYVGIPARVGLSVAHAREFLAFGGWLTGAGILESLRTQYWPSLSFGRFLGSAALGAFSVADTAAKLFTRELASPLSQAVAPGFAAIVHDPDRLRAAYQDAQCVLLGVVLPLGFGVAALAPDLVPLIVGEKWSAAAPVIRILAPVYATSLLIAGAGNVAQAMGRTRLMFGRSLVASLVALPAIWFGAQSGDLAVAAWGVAAGVLAETTMGVRMGARLSGLPALAIVARNWRSFLAAALMAVTLWALEPAGGDGELDRLVRVLPRVALGGVLFAGSLLLLWRLSGRPRGFETIALDNLIPRSPARLRPVLRRLRSRAG